MVYFGEFRVKIDRQGRLVIPSRLRTQLAVSCSESVYVAKGIESCLFLFSSEDWHSYGEKLKELPLTRVDPRTFTRLFFSGAFQAPIDKQGRILIPSNLLGYAGIKDNVVIVGAGTRIELWNDRKWDEYYESSLKAYEEISEKLMEL